MSASCIGVAPLEYRTLAGVESPLVSLKIVFTESLLTLNGLSRWFRELVAFVWPEPRTLGSILLKFLILSMLLLLL